MKSKSGGHISMSVSLSAWLWANVQKGTLAQSLYKVMDNGVVAGK